MGRALLLTALLWLLPGCRCDDPPAGAPPAPPPDQPVMVAPDEAPPPLPEFAPAVDAGPAASRESG